MLNPDTHVPLVTRDRALLKSKIIPAGRTTDRLAALAGVRLDDRA
jgi:hypothetical protein